MEQLVFRCAIDALGGVLIGIALLGQFFVNASVGQVDPRDSKLKKVAAFTTRIGAGIITFAVLVLVFRVIRAVAVLTIYDVLVVAAGMLTALFIGWKKK